VERDMMVVSIHEISLCRGVGRMSSILTEHHID
jgi:hypothetical protein